MAAYVTEAFGRFVWQVVQLIGIPFALAVLLQYVGGRIRRVGVGTLGDAYWYFVAPGVACHETGHAAGCLLTGRKITKFVPFCRRGDGTLGYVQYQSKRGIFRPLAEFLIASGPVWFGCMAFVILTKLFSGVAPSIRFSDYFAADELPGLMAYGAGLLSAAIVFLGDVVNADVWGWGFAIWLYLSFCIASEIGLSSVDLKSMWRGAMSILAAFAVANCIPPLGRLISMAIYVALPYLFKFHVIMAVALVANVILLVGVALVSKRVRALI